MSLTSATLRPAQFSISLCLPMLVAVIVVLLFMLFAVLLSLLFVVKIYIMREFFDIISEYYVFGLRS